MLYIGAKPAVDVRNEQWYPRYFMANESTLNNLVRKNNQVQIKMLGIQGCLTYGQRTRHEWTCLQEDINQGVESNKIKVRPKWVQVEFDDLEEEMEWADKKPNRVVIICSCPSRVSGVGG